MRNPKILYIKDNESAEDWVFTCMSGDGTFFLLRSTYWEILYIHRCILQDLVADV